jgi:hypothetical protein
MKLSRATKIGMAAVGGLLLLWGVLMIFIGTSSTRIESGKVDLTHCPDCGSALNKAGECPRCIAELGLEAYREKHTDKGFASSAVIPIALGCLLGLLLATHVGLNLWAYKKGKRPEVYYYVRCTKCGRKLRYRDTQVERLGKCPLCQKPMRFPRPPEKPRPNRWVKIAHLVWG